MSSEKTGAQVTPAGPLLKHSKLMDASESTFKVTGRSPQDYELGLDKAVTFNSEPSMYFGSTSNNSRDFGATIHYVDAHPYLGRKIEFSGSLKTEGTNS